MNKTSYRVRIASAALAVVTSTLVLGSTLVGLTSGALPEAGSVTVMERTSIEVAAVR
jgi:hypothetical protein